MTKLTDIGLTDTKTGIVKEDNNKAGGLKRVNSNSNLNEVESTKISKLENQLTKKFIKLSLWDIRNSKEIQNQNANLLSVTNPLQFALNNISSEPSENYPNKGDFLVENIIAKKTTKNDKVEYLIKWKDLEEGKCFWVNGNELEKVKEILDCFELSLKSGRKSSSTTTLGDETIIIETLTPNISIFMNLINHDNGHPISIVNTVDDTESPNFIYSNNFILNEDIREKVLTDKTKLLSGCSCVMCPPFIQKQKCDCIEWTGKNPYNSKGLVDMKSGDQIYECNLDCACAKITPCLCQNRVTQRKRKHKLQIYKTPNKGWAVRTLEDIPKGTFISIYTGLVMSLELANQLGKAYETKGFSYLFDLDGDTTKEMDPIYTVDATNYGNFSRFINHSCDPNLYILSVFTDHQDIHNIGLFAKRDIKAQEEICYDYTGGKHHDDNFDTGITCYCGATDCKKNLMM